MKRRIKTIAVLLMSIIIFSFVAAGCGAKKAEMNSESKPSMDISKENSGLSEGNASTSAVKEAPKNDSDFKDKVANTLDSQGKIIRNGIIQMETLSFDETVKQILNKTNSMGAYVQSSNVSGTSIEAKLSEQSRRGQFILRIPKTKFDSFILDIGNLGSITNQQISTEDVTSAYFDTQAHLKSLTIQEERLLELLKKTGELKDIIVLEKELSGVRYEIESLTGNLKKWDNLIDFCTLNIEVVEVHKIKENPVSFVDKIVNGFVSSVKSLIDFSKGICCNYIYIDTLFSCFIYYTFNN